MTALPRRAPVMHSRLVPGDGLLHPVALASIAVLIINDHVLKAAMPGLLTGKLSDIAGLVYFPLLLVAGWEWLRALAGRPRTPSQFALILAVAATAVGFIGVKLVPPATEGYAVVFGILQWPLAVAGSILQGSALPAVGLAHLVPDPTDLLMLPALFLAYWIGVRRVA